MSLQAINDLNSGLVSAAADIYNHSPYPLTYAGIEFLADEQPENLDLEGEQREAVHDLIGGGRNVQSLGRQIKDITFSGTWWDAGAFERSAQFARLYAEGKQHRLQFYLRAYDAVIRSYRENIRHQFKIEYTITLTVLRDRSGSTSVSSAPSIDEQVQALYAQVAQDQALVMAADPNAASLSGPISNMASSLDQATPLASAGAQRQATIASVQQAVSAAQTYVTGIAGSVLPTATQAAALRVLNGLQTIGKAVNAGQNVTTKTVAGGSLYALSSQFYGRPDYASVIAQANGLSSMILERGVTKTLIIPPPPVQS